MCRFTHGFGLHMELPGSAPWKLRHFKGMKSFHGGIGAKESYRHCPDSCRVSKKKGPMKT